MTTITAAPESVHKLRPIRFLVSNDRGSAVIRGHQPAEQLRALGYDAAVVGAQDPAVPEVRDALVVFVKYVERRAFERVKENRNIAIWNLSDMLVKRSGMPDDPGFDGVIFPTASAQRDFGARFGPEVRSTVIWSHADPRWRPARPWRYRLGYLGSRASLEECYRDLAGLNLLYLPPSAASREMDRYFSRGRRVACHFSVRSAGGERFLYKPNAKLAGAAASGVNIILSRDPVNLELLAAEYPYYTDSDLESVREAVRFARATYRGREWNRGLDMLRAVRQRTTLERIARDYLDYFRSF